jgi:hypothetical protein
MCFDYNLRRYDEENLVEDEYDLKVDIKENDYSISCNFGLLKLDFKEMFNSIKIIDFAKTSYGNIPSSLT